MLWILGIGTIGILVVEILRMRTPLVGKIFEFIFGKIVRVSEERSFTGATFTLIGSFVTILIFEKEVAVVALLILTTADSLAALVGVKWGKIPLLGKSAEGTATFFIIGIAIVFCFPELPRFPAVCGVITATIIELLPSPINDNLMIPITVAATISVGNLFV
ncbi:MAG: hypothetical protein H8E82_03360 [Candidatus Marinimicrobia bacterium]|nr:hypothetical protein [Candidatus Neomarinimicrobiota bacterium]MBL7046033.1 hypothetical protein [Candidatus Neomarinimicrobiota bacterium]